MPLQPMSAVDLPPSWHHRLTALLGVAVVVLLNVLAASPAWHARLHDREQASAHADHNPVGDSDHACAVTIFSHGATAPLAFALLARGWTLVRVVAWPARDRIFAVRHRYWHVPAQAPPQG